MKKFILITLSIFIMAFSCMDDRNELYEGNNFRLLTESPDTTFTIETDGYDNSFKEVFFDSSFMVTSIDVIYNGLTNDSRMFQLSFYDSMYSSVLVSDTTFYTFPQSIYGYIRGSDTISFVGLDKRTDYISMWGQSYPGNEFSYKITGHYSNNDGNEIVSVYLNDDNHNRIVDFNSSYNIKSIKPQYYGDYYSSFTAINNTSTINIADSASVHDAMNFITNQVSNKITIQTEPHIQNPSISDYGFWFFTVVVEK